LFLNCSEYLFAMLVEIVLWEKF